MTARIWIGVHNNPKVDPAEYLETWLKKGGARYVVGQLEEGAEKTPHIQFALNFQNSVR